MKVENEIINESHLNSGFEKYIVSLGYRPYVYHAKSETFIPWKPEYKYANLSYSSMGHLIAVYKKPKSIDITYGLHEMGYPPMLIYPRPKGCTWDAEMLGFEIKSSPEELYNIITKTSTKEKKETKEN